VPARIASTVPSIRLVYLIRDPVARMWSHYRHRMANGYEHRPFARAILESPAFIELSRYATQLERYLAYFDRSQLLVITQESLRSHRPDTVRQVFHFLGVDAGWHPPQLDQELNVSTPPDPMPAACHLPPATARYVATILEPEVERLRQLLGPAAPQWSCGDLTTAGSGECDRKRP
jgi:hypothetical protein